ncbi:MAG: hypothetical protein E7660_05130 [Ruminococcaceae bacterium]|nr:hypothetical protein [Oscillospiraceae bacterium]
MNENVIREKFSPFWLFIKYAGIFIIGAVGYGALEVLWRGYTHYSMLIAGGLVLTGAYFINDFHRGASLLLRWAAVSLLILTVELVFGLIFNMALGMAVWDYSDRALNFYGQICPLYGGLWVLISALVCVGLEVFRRRENVK